MLFHVYFFKQFTLLFAMWPSICSENVENANIVWPIDFIYPTKISGFKGERLTSTGF